MEAINKIKEAEDKAKQIIEDAKSQRSILLKDGEKLSKEKYEGIISSANAEKEESIQEALKIGENEAAPIFSDGKGEVEAILNTGDEKIKAAVDFIMKKVVNINGNS